MNIEITIKMTVKVEIKYMIYKDESDYENDINMN